MIYSYPEQAMWPELARRPALDQKDLSSVVGEVFRSILQRGDDALRDYTEKYDRVSISELEVSPGENVIDSELREAIDIAAANIRKFHESQRVEVRKVETMQGVVCWQESRPLSRVGLYIPGGTAPLFSTVLMLAIPAMIAGCKEVILCTPPGRDGRVHPAILYAAEVAGVHKIYRVGGAQAIAAMALGTESIAKVQKIFGPGNQYVTAAKQYAATQGVLIDMPAGPSELLVIASDTSIPNYVAADLLSQAEHGVDSQVICLCTSTEKAERIKVSVEEQIKILPRKEIAEAAMRNSKYLVLEDRSTCLGFTNLYAPEHLIIADDLFLEYVPEIYNAGSVFLGHYCPESAGDYASGTNHTLPTSGYASTYSGVNLDSFQKKITFQHISKDGIRNLGRTVEIMASAEGLQAHKNAVTVRLKDLDE